MPFTPDKPKILVVDDEPSILSSISDLLETEFDVVTETDPQRGLEDLVAEEFSVVISDQRMPNMNGDEFLRIAKEKCSATRVLLTGFADIEALGRVVNDGRICAYVTKPWNPLGLRATVRNAATEYRLLKVLRYERDLLGTLVDNIPDCIYIQDSAQHYTLVNRAFAEMAGMTDPREALGKTERECLTGNFGANAMTDGCKILETGLPIISKYDEWKRDDGAVRWYSSTRVPIRNPINQNIEGLVGISRDITEQKEIENHLRIAKETAEATVRAKQEFLARISHEIRTPLNPILGMAELLSETDLSEQQRKYVSMLRGSGEMLLRLLSDLLDLSRCDLHELKLASSDFDPRDVARAVVESFGDGPRNGVGLHLEYGVDIPTRLIGDSTRLKQILGNLVNNALKFTHQGTILIKMKGGPAEDGTVLLEFAVEDTGIGIATAKLDDIFEPFSQAEEFITGTYGGSGLGLAICRQLVHQMGGTIGVESSPDKGSIFRFTARFKIADAACLAPTESKLTKFAQSTSRGLNILVAEDNEDNIFLIQAYIGGEKIEIASNGREAVNKFISGKFDIVLMDLQMPELDGLQATRLIREWEQAHQMAATPVLACTAHSSAEEDSLQAGCTGHLVKPMAKKALLAAIAECVLVNQ